MIVFFQYLIYFSCYGKYFKSIIWIGAHNRPELFFTKKETNEFPYVNLQF